MAQIQVGDLARVREILQVLSRHGFGRMLAGAGLGRYVPDEADEGSGVEHWAVRIRKALLELGPTFVKLGQVLSVRPDIVPPRLAEELQVLQDRVPPVDFQAIRTVVEEDLQAPLEQVFPVFAPEALASASIAQVHLAELPDGTRVAVKVRRPDIVRVIRADLRILYTLARLVEDNLDLPGVYTPVTIVSEFEAALMQELDFFQEARNAERFRVAMEQHQPDVVVPRVYPKVSGSRVLVLERVEGQPCNAVEPSEPCGPAFARRLLEATFSQVFEAGLFHGDPHPGNLRALPDGRIAYLDFGLVGTITGEMQEVLSSMFMAVVFQDADSLVMAILRAGAAEERVDVRALRGEVERIMIRLHRASLSQVTERANLMEFMEVVTRHRLVLPREYAVLLRAASIVFGLTHRFLPDSDIVAEVRPLAQRLLVRQVAPDQVVAEAARMLMHARSSLSHLPLLATQIFADLEAGRLQVNARDPGAEDLRREIRDTGVRVSLALCAVGLAVAGAVMVVPLPWTIGGAALVPILGILTLLASSLIWVLLVVHTHFADLLRPREAFRHLGGFLRFLASRRTRPRE